MIWSEGTSLARHRIAANIRIPRNGYLLLATFSMFPASPQREVNVVQLSSPSLQRTWFPNFFQPAD